MNKMLQPVLVLNASYEPINIASVRRALNLLIKGKACVEEDRGENAHVGLVLPSVVRLREFCRVPHKSMVLSRRNIYLRDGYTCQYCGIQFSAKDLTLDHVNPRALGGQNRWENLVACCGPCNRKKDDQTLEEAGMKLLRPPRPLTIHTSRSMMRMMGHEEQSWRKYLYY